MSTTCAKEFDITNFGFGNHNRPHVFVTSQCGPLKLYPVWTVIALLYHLGALIGHGVSIGEATANYFLYLPVWSYLLLTLYALCDCVVTLYVHCQVPEIIRRRESNSSSIEVVMRNKVVNFNYKTMGEICTVVPWYLKLTWVLFAVAMPAALAVTLTYWATYCIDHFTSLPVHTIKATLLNENTFAFGSLALSTVNSLVVLIHIYISAKPFRILHFYLPMFFFSIYFIMTRSYQKISGNYVYQSLDWDDYFVTTSAVIGYVLIFVPLVHLGVYFIVRLRSLIGLQCQLKSAARMIKQREGTRVSRRNSKVTPATVNEGVP